MAKRVVDDASLTTVADAIRAKTGKTDGLTFPADFETSVEDVFAAGEKSEYDRFWDDYQQNGNRTNYTCAFGGTGWDDTTFKPKYDIRPTGPQQRIFGCTGITDLAARLQETGVVLDLSGATSIIYLMEDGSITDFPTLDLSKAASLQYLFNNCRAVRTIEKLVLKDDGSQAFGNMTFGGMGALEEIRFEGVIGQNGLTLRNSTKLSEASIHSLIAALSTTTTGLSVTLSLVAVNAAFETSEGAADGSTSAQWTQLANTKSNWTINLV